MALTKEAPVLIIDDSVAIRARMETYLKRLGFTDIVSAENIEDGLRMFRERKPNLVFLDLVIDEEKGTEFASEALAERPYTHVVLMTALSASHDMVTAAIAEGARDFLPKPIQYPTLKKIVDRLLENREDQISPDHVDASYV